jgi:hypothetical protein
METGVFHPGDSFRFSRQTAVSGEIGVYADAKDQGRFMLDFRCIHSSVFGRLFLWLSIATCHPTCLATQPANFCIEIVDEATGRGVPLVELQTVNEIVFVSDSAGRVAISDPDLLGQKVFFHIRSHGYEFPADGFGYRGRNLDCQVGRTARLSLRRINLAERLYRVTGGGIYRDSVLVGAETPLQESLLNRQVIGQDSVLQARFRNRLYWFWGDTHRPSYPLGNFHVPGATTPLPGMDGFDPDRGVNLEYFPGPDGFAKPTAQLPGDGPTWLEGLSVALDARGNERMFAAAMKIKPPLDVYRRSLVEWQEETREWKEIGEIPLHAPLQPTGHPFVVQTGLETYLHFATPLGLSRVRHKAESLIDLSEYEAYTCLRDESTLPSAHVELDSQGQALYRWRKGTAPLSAIEQAKLVDHGKLRREEGLIQLRDITSGKPVLVHAGTTSWNPFRKRWILVAVQWGGSSFLGEVWYSEAETPLGPWAWARKVVTHNQYSFYNPKHHPIFDSDGGRRIYFEGTYAATFSGNPRPTPRYDYNQVMYRLDLAHPGLTVPVAIGSLEDRELAKLTSRSWNDDSSKPGEGNVSLPQLWRQIPFFAPDQPGTNLIPIEVATSETGRILWRRGNPGEESGLTPRFYTWDNDRETPPEPTLELWQTQDSRGAWQWELRAPSGPSTKHGGTAGDYLGRVWPNPWQP